MDAGRATPGTDEPAGPPMLQAIDRPYGGFVRVLNAIGTVWIFAIAILVNSDVFSRFLFDSPVRGVAEMVSISLVGIVFLQLPSVLRADRMIQSNAFLDRILARKARAGLALRFVQMAAGAVLAAIVFTAVIPLLATAWNKNLYFGTQGDFTVAEWPLHALILLGVAMFGLQYVLKAWSDAARLIRSRDV